MHRTRNIALFSVVSLGGGYMMLKSKTLAEKQRERATGDFSVSVDRSGMNHPIISKPYRWGIACRHKFTSP
ncbi:hypothetical protein BDV95DRAFT_493928 [Massariosphaeria phaeospora]|uniref:Uncharacterized protein n=1 Tax=Massariosphaeria phaeospora TaxID=100035 RepID=A0A7C8IFH7_9PLEO|nr:hypothetical protein BDV95DRAFT_493928 [Massariosphaeria phaeospora]